MFFPRSGRTGRTGNRKTKIGPLLHDFGKNGGFTGTAWSGKNDQNSALFGDFVHIHRYNSGKKVKKMVSRQGLEPWTPALKGRCSTD